uniref:Uncharacterized protein n=1 Tax=viral metagenome TaxID=1070528 RepID=A0A6H1ZJI7_9ZZZZ
MEKDKVVGSLTAFVGALHYHKGFFVEDKFYSTQFLKHWSIAKLKSLIDLGQIFYALERR